MTNTVGIYVTKDTTMNNTVFKRGRGLAKCVSFALLIMTTTVLHANAYAWITSSTQPSACNTAMQASQTLVTGWQMNNRTVAGLCAYPLAVNTLFMKRASSQPSTQWRANGCTWVGVNRASCLYTFEGGAANLDLIELNTSQWRVASIQFIAD